MIGARIRAQALYKHYEESTIYTPNYPVQKLDLM